LGYIRGESDNGNVGGFHLEGLLGNGPSCAYLKADLTNRGIAGGYKYSQITGGTITSTMNVFMVSNTASTFIDLYVQYANSDYNGFNLDIKSFGGIFKFVNIEGTSDPRTSPTNYSVYWDLIASANFTQKASSGNVGIGTTNPTQKLEVAGYARISGSSDISRLILGPAPSSTNFDYCSIIESVCETASSAASSLKFYTHGYTVNSSDPTLAMKISPTGAVGIGVANPGVQLDLSTDGARKLSTSTWATGSDQRIKTDIQSANLQMCYDTVKTIDLKYFKWNFPESSNITVDDNHSLGFIAQEVKTVFPNAVSESNSYGYSDFLSLNTDQILKAMYGALKQTIADKEALEQSLATAIANFSSLEIRLAALEGTLGSGAGSK
jgi:hypothetical protein